MFAVFGVFFHGTECISATATDALAVSYSYHSSHPIYQSTADTFELFSYPKK